MVAVSFKFNPKDMAAFDKQMKRLASLPRKSMKDGIKVGTIKLTSSLIASTKKAKATRQILLPKRKDRGVGNFKQLFHVITYNDAGQKQINFVWANSKDEVRKMPIAIIKRRGTAKVVWNRALKFLFKKKLPTGVGRVKINPNAIRSGKVDKRGQFGIWIENNLDYARKAFKNKGTQDINTAMQRATTAVRKTVERAIAKANR